MGVLISRRSLLAMSCFAFAVPAMARGGLRNSVILLPTANGRISTISIWRTPARKLGTILFSHGALSAPAKYEKLIEYWVIAGFDVLAPLHVDSTDHRDTARYKGMASWAARIEDMQALARHIGKKPYIVAGHSYGALVALTIGGAAASLPEGMKGPLRDKNAKAVVAFSPPGNTPGLIDKKGYATLAVPALIQTGDRDVPPGSPSADAWRQHLLAYEAASTGGDRYAIMLEGVDHYFGGLICRPELPGPAQTEQFAVASLISTEFLRAYGSSNAAAKRSLSRRLNEAGKVRLFRK